MGTPLQTIYDSFFIKANESFLYKEDQVFKYFTTAIGKAYKTICKNLDFTLNKSKVIITVFQKSETDNVITLQINEDSYEIEITNEDSLIDIANKLSNELSVDYNVKIKKSQYPRLIISKEDADLTEYSIEVSDDEYLDIEISSSYDGYMISDLFFDDIELLAMLMHLEHSIKLKSELDHQKIYIGTKDFNKLPDKKVEYENVTKSIKDLEDRIFKFRQEFYPYTY